MTGTSRLALLRRPKSKGRCCVRSLVGAIFLLSIFSVQANGPAVLLLPFDNASGAKQFDALASGMPDILTACFSQFADELVVIERSSVSRAMNELGLSIEAYADPAAQQRAGAIVGADLVVRGSFTQIAGNLNVDVLTFSVTNATLVAAFTATLTSDAMIKQICSDLAAPMAAKLAELPALATPMAVDNPVQQALMMEGLGHYYTSDFIAAIAPFLKLVRIAQDNESAHYWLGKSFASAGLSDLATVQLNAYLAEFPDSRRSKEIKVLIKSLKQ